MGSAVAGVSFCLFVVVVVVVVADDDDVVGRGEAMLISLRILLMGTVK